MTIERAIEILDPENRDRYKSIYEFDQACRMGVEALKKIRHSYPENKEEFYDEDDT